MLRISGVVLPARKHLNIALCHIFGIGRRTAVRICDKVSLSPMTKVAEVTDDQAKRIQAAVNDYETEGDLRRRIAVNIKRLIDIKSYRGMRHRRGLPVRGQRTKTNAKTRKGKSRRKGGTKGSK